MYRVTLGPRLALSTTTRHGDDERREVVSSRHVAAQTLLPMRDRVPGSVDATELTLADTPGPSAPAKEVQRWD
jgi:hypothetical protein